MVGFLVDPGQTDQNQASCPSDLPHDFEGGGYSGFLEMANPLRKRDRTRGLHDRFEFCDHLFSLPRGQPHSMFSPFFPSVTYIRW